MTEPYFDLARHASDEIRQALESIDPQEASRFLERLKNAKRVFIAGAGRTGFSAQAFAMRLVQMDVEAHVAGEATCPAAGPGDLVIGVSGSGETPTILTILDRVKKSGATVLLLVGVKDSSASKIADETCVIRHSGKTDAKQSCMALGSLFEEASLLFFDILIALLMKQKNLTNQDLQKRHSNLE